jgi:hypothetical protein
MLLAMTPRVAEREKMYCTRPGFNTEALKL